VAEQKQLAEERAAEEARLEDERKLERKRLEKQQREEQEHQAMMKKLEAKRAEAALRPQKEVAPKAPKPVKKIMKVDPSLMFTIKDQHAEEPDEGPQASEEAYSDEEDGAQAAPAASAPRPTKEKVFAPEQRAAKTGSKFEEAAKAASKLPADHKKPKAPAAMSLKEITEEEIEKKKQAKLEAEARKHEEMMRKLEERRAAAAAEAEGKPEKDPPPQPKKKAEKARKINAAELFNIAPTQRDSDDEPAVEEAEVVEAVPEAKNGNHVSEEPKKPAPPPKIEPVSKPKPKPVKKPAEPVVSKWGAPAAAAPATSLDEEGEDAAPSLADAMKDAGSKASKPAAPKKGGKAKFSKVSAFSLGFDDNNPNMPRSK